VLVESPLRRSQPCNSPIIADVIDRATQQNPEMRTVTVGNAVKAMVPNGLGFVNQRLYLVPMFFHNKPTQRLSLHQALKPSTSTPSTAVPRRSARSGSIAQTGCLRGKSLPEIRPHRVCL
jgi:hypothetical protein